MILNAYTVLVLLMNAIRLPAALCAIVLAGGALWRLAPNLSSERRQSIEDRNYLLVLLIVLLVCLNVASWPLLYSLLQSYVPEWSGVMCIFGVTKIGTGSRGIASYLPGILAAVQWLKPMLLFSCGVWFVMYWVNRQSQTAHLMRRVLAAALFVAVLSLVDSGLETAYAAIPKRSDIPHIGCCTTGNAFLHGQYVPSGLLADGDRAWLSEAYYAINGLLIVGLAGQLTMFRLKARGVCLATMLAGTVLALPVGFLFLVEIAAPTILHLPLHRCAYDLIPVAPESLIGIALFMLGSFAVGWACVAAWLTRGTGSTASHSALVDKTLFVALFGYTSSLLIFALEMMLNTHA